MKIILLILLCFNSVIAFAQNMQDQGLSRVRIIQGDTTVVAEINPVSNKHIKSNLYYFWYGSNRIHQTQGGFSGKLLDGSFTEYYPNKNLMEQGNFKKGLKDGIWKSWNADGALLSVSYWDDGVRISDKKLSIWKKLNVFEKNKRQYETDSLKKMGN